MIKLPKEIKLLPCPFCGSDGLLHKSSIGHRVVCQNTMVGFGGACDIGSIHRDWTEEYAVKMWNRRTNSSVDQSLVEALKDVCDWGELVDSESISGKAKCAIIKARAALKMAKG